MSRKEIATLKFSAALYGLIEREGWSTPDAILASADKRWALGPPTRRFRNPQC
jgi:hypothetical protein